MGSDFFFGFYVNDAPKEKIFMGKPQRKLTIKI